MALFDPLLDLAGTVRVVVGVAIAVGGIPYAALTGQAPVVRSGLLYAAGGVLVLGGGVVLHPKTYEAIDVPGFEERSERAVCATLVFVSVGAYIVP